MREEKNIEKTIIWIVVVVLFIVVYILITGMITATLKFNKNIWDPLASFSGALIGALISGVFATNVFNKQIKHEIEKEKEDLANKLNVTKMFIVQRNRLLGINAYILIEERRKEKITKTEKDHEDNIEFFIDNKGEIEQFISSVNEVKKDVYQYIYQKDIQAEELKLIGKLINNIDQSFSHYNSVINNINKPNESKRVVSWSITDLLNSMYRYEQFVDQLEVELIRAGLL